MPTSFEHQMPLSEQHGFCKSVAMEQHGGPRQLVARIVDPDTPEDKSKTASDGDEAPARDAVWEDRPKALDSH
jgi:hypothetical protein